MAYSAGHDAMVLHLPSSGRCEYATVKKKKNVFLIYVFIVG